MKREKVLVTGGTGFIGSHLVRRLVVEGAEVTVLDLFPSDQPVQGVQYIIGDVRDPITVSTALAGCDSVFHLAAAHHDSGISEDTYFSVNVQGTLQILSACRKHFVKKLCFYSSVAVYGSGSSTRDETSDPRADNPYGRSKLEAEKLIVKFAEESKVPCLIVRPTVTFGEGNFANMYSLMGQIYHGRFVHVGAGSNIKSMGYVHNLIDMTLHLWKELSGETVVANWVEPESLISREIAARIAKRMERQIPAFVVPLWFALIGAFCVEILVSMRLLRSNITRARVRKLAEEQTSFAALTASRCGFVPRYSFDEALDRTVEWYIKSGRSLSVVRRLPPPSVDQFRSDSVEPRCVDI